MNKTKLSDFKDSLIVRLEEKGELSLKITMRLFCCVKVTTAPVVSLFSKVFSEKVNFHFHQLSHLNHV